MRPMFLTLLLLLPLARADVDCRAACHSCRAKLDPREMLEIYCAMCQECKERRKDRLKAKIELAKHQTTTTAASELNTLPENKLPSAFDIAGYNDPPPATLEGQDDDAGDLMNIIQDIPEGCPTAPPCPDDEFAPIPLQGTTTSTTSTTTTQRPCPPVKPCMKKPTPKPPPLPSPAPPHICPPPPYVPASCNHHLNHVTQSPPMLLPPPSYYQNMPPPAIVPHYPAQWAPPAYAAVHALPAPSLLPSFASFSSRPKKTRATDADYLYLYVGLPKNVVNSS